MLARSKMIVIEHKDRGTRFGFRYIEKTLLQGQGRAIEVVNQAENGMEDILADLTSIIYSFCARLYGQRRAKRKTEQIVQQFQANGDTDAMKRVIPANAHFWIWNQQKSTRNTRASESNKACFVHQLVKSTMLM